MIAMMIVVGQCGAMRGNAEHGKQCEHRPTTIVGAPLVGARIAIHCGATIAMIAMMVVVGQCEARRGDAGQCGAMRDTALHGGTLQGHDFQGNIILQECQGQDITVYS